MHRNKDYELRAQQFFAFQVVPISVRTLMRSAGCSRSTAYRLIDRYWAGLSAWQPDGRGRFYTIYFPIGTSVQEAFRFLNLRVNRGKTRAKVYECARGRKPIAQYRLVKDGIEKHDRELGVTTMLPIG